MDVTQSAWWAIGWVIILGRKPPGLHHPFYHGRHRELMASRDSGRSPHQSPKLMVSSSGLGPQSDESELPSLWVAVGGAEGAVKVDAFVLSDSVPALWAAQAAVVLRPT